MTGVWHPSDTGHALDRDNLSKAKVIRTVHLRQRDVYNTVCFDAGVVRSRDH